MHGFALSRSTASQPPRLLHSALVLAEQRLRQTPRAHRLRHLRNQQSSDNLPRSFALQPMSLSSAAVAQAASSPLPGFLPPKGRGAPYRGPGAHHRRQQAKRLTALAAGDAGRADALEESLVIVLTQLPPADPTEAGASKAGFAIGGDKQLLDGFELRLHPPNGIVRIVRAGSRRLCSASSC